VFLNLTGHQAEIKAADASADHDDEEDGAAA
jgi:hypothetical protein